MPRRHARATCRQFRVNGHFQFDLAGLTDLDPLPRRDASLLRIDSRQPDLRHPGIRSLLQRLGATHQRIGEIDRYIGNPLQLLRRPQRVGDE